MTTTGKQLSRPEIDLVEASMELGSLSAIERIRWGVDLFGEDAHGLTSGGIHSAVLSRLIQKAGFQIEEELIDTGNLHREAIEYARRITRLDGHRLNITTSVWGEMTDDQARSRRDEDPDRYRQVTKLEPLSRAISERGIKALFSGVRADQTDNRAGLDFINLGRDGEFRIHPIYDWTEEQVISFIEDENLPPHPLSGEYGSLGDRITTTPGEGRSGRESLGPHLECGIHLDLPRRELAKA